MKKESAYYEAINFIGGGGGLTAKDEAVIDDDVSGIYEDVIVNDLTAAETSSPNYENVVGHQSNGDGRTRSSNDVDEYDFGIARRFPSIRLNSAAKKAAKKQQSSNTFPRQGGNSISIDFDGSIGKEIYSKPNKANTIAPGVLGSKVDIADKVHI